MKKRIISITAILASTAFAYAGSDRTRTMHKTDDSTHINSKTSASASMVSSTKDIGYGRADRTVGTTRQIHDTDNDNILTDAAGNNYFMPVTKERGMQSEGHYGRNDRDVTDRIDTSTYADRTGMRDDIKAYVYHMDKSRRDSYMKNEEEVSNWRNKLRTDLEKLDRSTEDKYEEARQNVRKSFDGYLKADAEAKDRFKTGAQRTTQQQ